MGCCEHGGEPSGSGTTELVFSCTINTALQRRGRGMERSKHASLLCILRKQFMSANEPDSCGFPNLARGKWH
jgi:hypothetical protein